MKGKSGWWLRKTHWPKTQTKRLPLLFSLDHESHNSTMEVKRHPEHQDTIIQATDKTDKVSESNWPGLPGFTISNMIDKPPKICPKLKWVMDDLKVLYRKNHRDDFTVSTIHSFWKVESQNHPGDILWVWGYRLLLHIKKHSLIEWQFSFCVPAKIWFAFTPQTKYTRVGL